MKIKDLFHFEKGVLQSSKCIPGEFDFITASSEWKSHNEYTHDCEALIFAAAASGSLGRTHYVNGKFISSDLCFIITPKDQKKYPIDLKFYHLIFQTLKDEIVRNTKAGTSKEAIGLTVFGNYELPYFDIAKQIETKEKFVNAQESTVSFSTELTHQLTLVKQLRQSLLREAMQGKLTADFRCAHPELIEGENSAQALLEKIKVNRNGSLGRSTKKEKELAPVSEDEIPFDIPDGWVWCRLGEIMELLTDYHANGGYETLKDNVELLEKDDYAIMLRTTNFHCDKYSNYKYITEKAYNFLEKSKVYPGDLIMNKIGDPGSVFFVDDRGMPMSLAMNLFLLRFPDNISNQFIYLYLKTHSEYVKSFSKGSTTMTITKDAVKELLIPLPPLSEQQAIVSKLDELMRTCDELEASIRNSQKQNEMLLREVLREALEG